MRTALLGLLATTLASCGHFGAGIAELPSEQGWQVLPTRKWIIEDGIRPESVVFCPADTCPAPAMVALFRLEGAEADRIETLLARDPAEMLRRKEPALRAKSSSPKPSRPGASRLGTAPSKSPHPKPPHPKPPHPGSDMAVEPLSVEGFTGARILIRSRAADGRQASGVVLARRDGARLALAVAVTTAPEPALAQARAALRSTGWTPASLAP